MDQFLSRMSIDYEKWHDGTGYNLSAIDRMTPSEREFVTRLFVERQPPTWRDLEALHHINSQAARKAINAILNLPSNEVRVAAARYMEKANEDKEAALISALSMQTSMAE